MRNKRRNHSGKFKAKVALAAFKVDETVVELSRQSEVHPNQTTSWRASNTMDVSFCVEALEKALGRYDRPGIFNTGQESLFTSEAFTEVLKEKGIRVSMDGKGSWRDNVFVKRLCVVLSPRETGILSRCEFPDATDGGTERDNEIDRRVHAEIRDTAKKALLLPSRHAGQEAEFRDGKVGKRQVRLEYVGLTPLTPDAEGKRVARDADGNVALRWKTESQFQARLQRWIFE